MGVLSSLNKELKKGFKKGRREVSRHAEDLIDVTGVGQILSPKELRMAGQRSRVMERQAKALQLKQKRKSILEGAELSNEIALRSKVAKKGGRRSLLSGGEKGFMA